MDEKTIKCAKRRKMRVLFVFAAGTIWRIDSKIIKITKKYKFAAINKARKMTWQKQKTKNRPTKCVSYAVLLQLCHGACVFHLVILLYVSYFELLLYEVLCTNKPNFSSRLSSQLFLLHPPLSLFKTPSLPLFDAVYQFNQLAWRVRKRRTGGGEEWVSGGRAHVNRIILTSS